MALATKKVSVFKDKLPREEMIYRNAVGLMESVDCINRFERKSKALVSAAVKFESLGTYKESEKYALQCRDMAAEVEKTGAKDVYDMACEKMKKAVTKSQYMDAIEHFERVVKKAQYRENAREHINYCKKRIKHIESVKLFKRRLVAVIILALICFGLTKTPFYPIGKGIYHRMRGQYKVALSCYNQAKSVPGVGRLKRVCYYKFAKQYQMEENEKKALKYFRKAASYADAPKFTVKIERKFIKSSKIGDAVQFAGRKWILVKRNKNSAVMVLKGTLERLRYSTKEKVEWKTSDIKYWMKQNYPDGGYVSLEKEITKKANLMTRDDYNAYKALLPLTKRCYWLKDVSDKPGEALVVTSEGNITGLDADRKVGALRPIITIKLR